MSRDKLRLYEHGFTIVELMIATLVFSTILLLITIGVLDFNKTYYQGVIQSNTQNVARQVLENVSQAIQFSANSISTATKTAGKSRGFCIGDQLYSYLIGYQLVDGSISGHQAHHTLVRETLSGCDSSSSARNLQAVGSLPSDGTELLGQHMRLAVLDVSSGVISGTYDIKVRVVYGDDDLLCSPSGVPGSCNSTATMTKYNYPDLRCKPQIGSQFCAVSELATTVGQRLN